MDKTRRVAVVCGIVAAGTVCVVAPPAAAGTPECFGAPATIVGTAGPDVFVGTPGADVIVAGRGNDVINGRGGPDSICGGRGHDTLRGGRGDDRISGGAGHDYADGGRGKDLILGNAGNDALEFLRSDAFLQSVGFGDDRLVGGAGLDYLHSEPGNDQIVGGPGSDLVDFVSAGAVTANLTTGTATGDGNDTLEGVENLFGSGFFDDVLIGDASDNFLFGGSDSRPGALGRDLLDGRGGDDRLGLQDDFGNDRILGGPGDDAIVGGEGNDQISAGPGADSDQRLLGRRHDAWRPR